LYNDGNSPDLKEMFARLAITGEMMSAHIVNNDVGNASSGDDLLGNLFINFSKSEGSMSLKLSIGCPLNCLV